MPHLFIFLLKVNLALLVFCAGYYLVLRRLTFYTLNRIYLVGAILFASIYPKLNFSAFLQHHQRIAEPVQALAFTIQTPPRDLIKPIAHHHSYWQYAEVIFWAGVILFALRLAIQFISLYRIYKNSSKGRLHGYDVRLISGDGGPFSFWKSIYVNPDKHAPTDMKAILQHEQIHVSEWHTADILLSELSTIFYWFNPGVWLMKKAIRENIEFITDRKILREGADSKQYQYSLVNVSFAAAPAGIVNHFNISTIKKRIIMMNAKRSSKLTLTRYAFLVPAIIVLLLIVTVSRAALAKHSSYYANPAAAIKAEVGKAFTARRHTDKLAGTGKKKKEVFIDTSKRVKLKEIAGTDTNKKLGLTVKKNKLIIEPSMYIVDGVITKDYDISKADTSEIESINIGKSFKDGKTVVYITTKNGMVTKPITAIRINGSTAKRAKGRVGSGSIYYTDTFRTVEGHPLIDTVYVQNFHTSPLKTSTSEQGKPITVRGATLSSVKVSPFTTYSYSGQSLSSSELSLSHLSDKLIIINGNVATQRDLKRISAFDIDRIVLKTDDETKELYGERAKNGVVFIVTKKK